MLREMFLILLFLHKKSPAFVQTGVTLLTRNLLSLEPEICINAQEESINPPGMYAN